MAEIVGAIIGAIVTIGKIIYDECNKIGKKVTSCGDAPVHDDDTPVPDEDEKPRHRIKIELGKDTIKRIILRNITWKYYCRCARQSNPTFHALIT